MQKIKRKESVKLRNFLHITIKANAWAIIAPVTTVLGGASLWLVLALNGKARTEASAFVSTLPQPLSSLQIILAASLLLPLVIAFYFWLDFQQQALLFKKEDPTFIYTALQHAKKVVLPKLRYNWKQAFYWVGYGLVSIFMIASVVAGRVQPAFAYAPDEFVTTWKTDNPGTSSSTQITIPTTGFGYNYNVDWGDGNTDTGQTGNITHTYASAGTYEVIITGDFPRIYFNNGGDRRKILTVEQWGTNAWASMQDSFMGASNLQVPASDAPDLSNVTSLEQMFSQATAFNSSIDHWDVSNVQSFNSMFHTATSFNQPLNSWTTTSLTSMSAMFYGADSFNQPLSNWDVSGVSDFAAVFNSADAFNQSLAGWDVSGATDMSVFLSGTAVSSANYDATLVAWSGLTLQNGVTMMATGVNYCNAATERSSIISTYSWTIMDAGLDCSDQPQAFITTWKTDNPGSSASNQITIPTTGTGYNYDVDWGDGNTDFGVTGNITHTYASVGTYTVSISGDLPRIYFNNTGDRQKILTVEQWGDIGWASMERAFMGASNLQVNAVDAPDLSGVTSTAWMFYDAESLNQSLDGWGTSNVTDMRVMFANATSFNQPLNSWDTSSVAVMDQMFAGATSFNQPLNSWDTSSVVRMESMFYSASSFNQDISSWDVSNVITTKEMFISATSFNQPLNSWNVGSVTDMEDMFAGADSFNQPLNSWNVGSVTNMSGMFRLTDSFNQPLDNWDTSSVLYMGEMFKGATVFNEEIGAWNTGAVRYMNSMFEDTAVFNRSIDHWDVSSVTRMDQMFAGATSFNQPLNSWDTSSVVRMESMFYSASSFNQDISSWNVSNVDNMSSMFSGASSFNSPLNSWDTGNVTTMRWMFADATSFNQPINNWDMSRNSSLQQMFSYATSFNQPLNSWDTSGISNMYAVFNEASSFNQSLDSWDVSNITNMSYMFNNTALSSQNYDATLTGWSSQSLQNGVSLGASGVYYCTSGDERQSIIDTYGWTISDAGKDPACSSFITTWKTDNPGESDDDQITIPVEEGVYGHNYDIDWGDGNTDSGVTGSITHTYASPGTYTVEISGDFPQITFKNYTGHANHDPEKLISVEQWGDMQWQAMDHAFSGAKNLVINASDTPDLSSVTDMTHMFDGAESLNSNLGGWDVSNVIDMSYALYGATTFNQDISAWDVSSVTDMELMLANAQEFNQPLNSWDVSSVTSTAGMFSGAVSFNQPLDNWDVSNVTEMWGMFGGYSYEVNDNVWTTTVGDSSFNQDISSWDVSSVTDMAWMFEGATAFNQPLNTWDVGSVTNMRGMFTDAVNFNQPLNNWDTSSVTNMMEMFSTALAIDYGDLEPVKFNQNINSWDVSNVTTMHRMFENATEFNQPLDNWDVSNVTDMTLMFSTYERYADEFGSDFNQPLNNWDTGSATDMSGMFRGAYSFNQPLNNWDTSSVITMRTMFHNAKNFNGQVNDWDTSRVEDLISVFHGATSFNQPLNNWDVSNVTYLTSAFLGATSFNQPLNSWDVSSVVSTNSMFALTPFNQPLNSWDVSNVRYFSAMFFGAEDYNQPVDNWDTSSATEAVLMFAGASSFDQSLAGWDVSSIAASPYSSMINMFNGEPLNYGGFVLAPSGLSTANYDATLTSWSAQGLQSGVQFDAGISTYCDAEGDRQSIINDFSWTINDSGKDCGNEFKQVNTLQPEKISSSQAKLKGSVSGAGASNFVSAGFQWGKTSNYGNTSSGLSINSSKFSKSLSFECDTQYHYRAFAVDGEGNKKYGANTTFTLSCPDVVDPDVPPDTTNAAAPKARIISPKQGEGFKTGSDITLKADITVGTDPIKEVRFYINGELYKTVTEKPYETVFKQAEDGIYRLIVVVEDVNGKEFATGERTFAVNKNGIGLLPLESVDDNKEASLGVVASALSIGKSVATTAAKNLPWILLQILGLIYLLQSWLEARSNKIIKTHIALARQAREGLDGFLHIASHYLVTPVTTMLLSLESIKEQDRYTANARESLGELKNYVNQLVADLNTKAGDVKSQLESAGKIKRHSVLLWVVAPVIAAVLLLGVGVVGASSFGVWSPSRNYIIFNTVLLAMSAGSTLFFFELWQRQRQLTSDLHVTQKATDAALQSRTEFIIENQAQLEQRFNPIQGYAEKLVDSPFKKTFISGQTQFKKVLSAFGAVASLTNRAPQSKTNIWRGAPFINQLKQRSESPDVSFSYSGEETIHTKLTPDEIEEVMNALVENATQFTQQGSISLAVENKSGLKITVKDTGSGISKDKVDTLMQPFARGTDTHTYNYEGIGLNLYIVRLIAEKYGGSVVIDSKQGHGTTITFSAPNRVVSD